MSIDLSVTEGVALITINRPERLNALDTEHYAGLSQAWQTVRDDSAIRVAVVTGAGEKSFSTGADLKSFIPKPPELAELLLTQKSQLLNRGLEVWKPVIAAVNGYCLGGGMTLLLAADLSSTPVNATYQIISYDGVFFHQNICTAPINSATLKESRSTPTPMLAAGTSV